MSDSEDDFASADEGEIGASPPGIDKISSKESQKVVEESKAEGKPDKDKNAVTDSNSSVQNTSKDSAKDSKGSEKSSKTVGGESAKSKKKGNNTDAGQKAQGSSGKKGKRKGKKGKASEVESVPSGPEEVEKTKENEKNEDNVEKSARAETAETLAESSLSKIRENKSLTSDKIIERKEEGETEIEKSIEISSKNEMAESQENKNKVSDPSSDKDNDPTSEEPKSESLPDSSKLCVAEKADLIKSPSSQSITRMDPDHSEKQEAVLDRLARSAKQPKGGWGWGWGSSLLEVASSSVSTFTHQVGEGLHTMMETVESTLNVPNPEELAQKVEKEREEDSEKTEKDGEPAEAEDNSRNDNKSDKNQAKNTSESPITSQTMSTKDGTTVDNRSAKDGKTVYNQSAKDDKTVDNQSAKDGKTVDNQSAKDGKSDDNQSGDGWFAAWGVSNISKMVENTGKSLVTGSLDVLETLGKKTFDVINEQDPGLRKARNFLRDSGNKPNLSAILRDAKEQHEAEAEHQREFEEACKAHFGSLFDDFQGLAHLEALEMLSNQGEKRVNVHLNAMSSEALAEVKPILLQIKHIFEMEESEDTDTEHDFTMLVKDLLQELNIGTTPEKLLQTCKSIEEKLHECCDAETTKDVKEMHRLAISSLAELTSKCIEHFHKTGELILIKKSPDVNFIDCSKTLFRLSQVMVAEIGMISTKYSECLNKQEIKDERELNKYVTNIYLEASNSSSYIQDGFQLLLPVLQQAAIETSRETES